jgi:hypothetical protein
MNTLYTAMFEEYELKVSFGLFLDVPREFR